LRGRGGVSTPRRRGGMLPAISTGIPTLPSPFQPKAQVFLLSFRPEACNPHSCHLDRRPKAGAERSGRELAVSAVRFQPPSIDIVSPPQTGLQIPPRHIRGQMSRLRFAPLDMTKGGLVVGRHEPRRGSGATDFHGYRWLREARGDARPTKKGSARSSQVMRPRTTPWFGGAEQALQDGSFARLAQSAIKRSRTRRGSASGNAVCLAARCCYNAPV
jgi:hypothetical protein